MTETEAVEIPNLIADGFARAFTQALLLSHIFAAVFLNCALHFRDSQGSRTVLTAA